MCTKGLLSLDSNLHWTFERPFSRSIVENLNVQKSATINKQISTFGKVVFLKRNKILNLLQGRFGVSGISLIIKEERK